MTDWYIEISESAPLNFKSDDYLAGVIDTAKPFMDYFCERLTELSDWKLEEAHRIFKEIIEEMPIMSSTIYENEFWINYNKWVRIRLTETTQQIYRDSKIKQILA